MKSTWLRYYKQVSTNVSNDVAEELRVIAFRRGFSIQELFGYFATLVVGGNNDATKIVDGLVKDKLQREIEKHGVKPFKASLMKDKDLSPPDADVIYDLLDKHDPCKR